MGYCKGQKRVYTQVRQYVLCIIRHMYTNVYCNYNAKSSSLSQRLNPKTLHFAVKSFLYVSLKSFIIKFKSTKWNRNKKVASNKYLIDQYVKKEHFIFSKSSPCPFLITLTSLSHCSWDHSASPVKAKGSSPKLSKVSSRYLSYLTKEHLLPHYTFANSVIQRNKSLVIEFKPIR